MQVWDLLTNLSAKFPVDGNKGGSYLTMLSKGGFVFGIINIIGNFGTVYNDQVRRAHLHSFFQYLDLERSGIDDPQKWNLPASWHASNIPCIVL